ncbi:MAG: L,D-transpeptidase [Bacteroidetes bacterium]|nr:L,D-transpeptidase [Bacteroidota bacterium]
MQNSDLEINEVQIQDEYSGEYSYEEKPTALTYFLPSLLMVFIIAGMFEGGVFAQENTFVKNQFLTESKLSPRILQSGFNVLSEENLAEGLMDTVYTDKDNWLELKIHEQMVYVHWRNGKTDKYPVSTGNKFLDKGLESRPGLFAIFVKEEHHESSQFDNADMYHFMPFNQGIGFHSINGTAYYQHLGVRPSSHGCIRMKHEDVKKMFGDVELGTIVLAHRGKFARTVAFAPKDYDVNQQAYTPQEYKQMLAENLYNVLNGKYYVADRKYFVVDPKMIPKSGVYIGYDREIPKKQEIPKPEFIINYPEDKLTENLTAAAIKQLESNPPVQDNNDETTEFVSNDNSVKKDISVSSSDELVKKYFSNPIGVLPYFPPTKK